MIIKNKLIPFGRYQTINLFGILFTKVELDKIDINHEYIHTVQMLEIFSITALIIITLIFFLGISSWWLLMAVIAYYLLYGLEYLCIRLKHSKQNCAYHDISFEEEAYNNQHNLKYITKRKPFAWVKYLKSIHIKNNCNNEKTSMEL